MTHPVLDRPDVLRVRLRLRRDRSIIPNGAYPVTAEAAPDLPALLYHHGNGEIAADYDDIAQDYPRLGITLLAIDYRGDGVSKG